MRTVLASLLLLLPAAALASDGGVYTTCDSEVDALGPSLVRPPVGDGGYAADCPLRVVAYPEVPGGIRFVHQRNGVALAEVTSTARIEHRIPEWREECDGSTTFTEHVGAYEYGHAFYDDARIGDSIAVFAEGRMIDTVSIVETGCPTLDWAPRRCIVRCTPIDSDNAGGCTAGGDASTLAMLGVLAVLLARRRLCA